jgi:hypothetical protein
MGIKLAIINCKNKTSRISVSFDALQYRRATKTFKITEQTEALDFANALENRYITVFDEELRGFAQETEHPILTSKNLCFVWGKGGKKEIG